MTDATAIDANDDAVAGEWQQLRLELTASGTLRWKIDGELIREVENAMSTSVDLSCIVGVSCKGNAAEIIDIDYLDIECGRDWTP